MARWVSWNCLRLVMLTGYLGARAKRLCLCLWRRSCGSSRGSESRGLSSSREARAASATASFVRRPCVAAWSDPACDNGGLHMPKVAVRPLRSSSYRFPHASPVSTSGAGKQEAAPEDHFKPLISLGSLERAKGFEPSTPTLARLCQGNLVRTAGLEPALSERNRFSYHFGFRRRHSAFVAWTVPSPWPLGRRRRPSSLYTFPQSRVWLGIGLGLQPVSVPRL